MLMSIEKEMLTKIIFNNDIINKDTAQSDI